jgi:hypothetical protein
LLVEMQTQRLTARLRHAELVTYRQREPDHPFLDDILRRESRPGGALWIVSWGFDVPPMLRRLAGRPVAYHAHSSGYGFDLPAGVPILAVSRNTLGYWGDRAPRHPLFLVPNALQPRWLERGDRQPLLTRVGQQRRRRIDVLVQDRKNSRYVIDHLVPALVAAGLRVERQRGWVEDLVDLFNDSTVVLYDSADYWRGTGLSEGFGLPPIEALACGCVVFSSFNHALADSLDPGLLGHQIGCGMAAGSGEAGNPVGWLRGGDPPETLAARPRGDRSALGSAAGRCGAPGQPFCVAAAGRSMGSAIAAAPAGPILRRTFWSWGATGAVTGLADFGRNGNGHPIT